MKTTEGKMFLKDYHCLGTQGQEQVEDEGVCGGIYRYDLIVKENRKNKHSHRDNDKNKLHRYFPPFTNK